MTASSCNPSPSPSTNIIIQKTMRREREQRRLRRRLPTNTTTNRALPLRFLPVLAVLLLATFGDDLPSSFQQHRQRRRFHAASAALLQGCNFGDDLCDPDEVCLPDGLFGQCYSDAAAEMAQIRPLLLDDRELLTPTQNELLREELTRLADNGLDWPHARAQCVLAYFKLTVAYQLDYQPGFCSVRNPNAVWALVQRFQTMLLRAEEEAEEAAVAQQRDGVAIDRVPLSLLEQQPPPGEVEESARDSMGSVGEKEQPLIIVVPDGEEGEGGLQEEEEEGAEDPEQLTEQLLKELLLDQPKSPSSRILDEETGGEEEPSSDGVPEAAVVLVGPPTVLVLDEEPDDSSSSEGQGGDSFSAGSSSGGRRQLVYELVDDDGIPSGPSSPDASEEGEPIFVGLTPPTEAPTTGRRSPPSSQGEAEAVLVAPAIAAGGGARNSNGGRLLAAATGLDGHDSGVLERPPTAGAAGKTRAVRTSGGGAGKAPSLFSRLWAKVRGTFSTGGSPTKQQQKRSSSPDETAAADSLSAEERGQLDMLVASVLASSGTTGSSKKADEEARRKPLSRRQLGRLSGLIRQLQAALVEQLAVRQQQWQRQQDEDFEGEDGTRGPGSDEEAFPLSVGAIGGGGALRRGLPPSAPEQFLLLKKDAERFSARDMGLAHIEHKIVKGDQQEPAAAGVTDPDRVYVKMSVPPSGGGWNLTDAELLKLIGYMEAKIGAPNGLLFNDFLWSDEDGQLSFRVARVRPRTPLTEEAEQQQGGEGETDGQIQQQVEKGGGDEAQEEREAMEDAAAVAQQVYKRRKALQTLIEGGLSVEETGVGDGQDEVAVVRRRSLLTDWLFVLPMVAICCAAVCAVLVIFAYATLRHRRRGSWCSAGSGAEEGKGWKKGGGGIVLPQVIDQLDAKASSIYEEFCRLRNRGQQVQPSATATASTSGGEVPPTAVTVLPHQRAHQPSSRHSSSSSWPDESVSGPSIQLDINTGHVVLSFLQEHLAQPEEIAAQWASVVDYANVGGETRLATEPANAAKNWDPSVVPYDENAVLLQASPDLIEVLAEPEHQRINKYINASRIYDSDARQATHIAAQGPLAATVADFWQMVWEQGVAAVVNLCQPGELQQQQGKTGGRQQLVKYWPDEGSKQFGPFEVHLVSEHVWSEDYVVRSLYLKNTATNETRTVTQFHFLTWPENGVPASNRALLEFRRKVNKSYRGRASPVLVHCSDGAGRTGTYCLIDMVANRITRGVKEMNMAAAFEHLRDQRMRCLATEDQYRTVFSCVAEEVAQLVRSLQR